MSDPGYYTLNPFFDELSDDRVIVRPYQEEDAQELFDAIGESRAHLRPWLPFADEHQNREETRAWINATRAKWLVGQDLNMCVCEKAYGRFLGGLGLHVHEWEIGYFAIGYWLRASASGQGYMTLAVRLLMEYAFNSLKAQRLEIRCDERNTRSAGVARRLGFVQEGCLRHDSRGPDGLLRNTLIFGLLPEETVTP